MRLDMDSTYIYGGQDNREEPLVFKNDDFSICINEVWHKDIRYQYKPHQWRLSSHEIWEVRMVMKGECSVSLNDQQIVPLKAGDFIIIPSYMDHYVLTETNSIIKCGVEFVLKPNETEKPSIYPFLWNLLSDVQVHNYSRRAAQLMEQMLWLTDHPGMDYETNVLFLAMAFLMDLLNTIVAKADETVVTRETRVDKAMGFIHNTVTAATTVNDVAEQLKLSAKQLNRIFTAETGTTVGAFIAQARQNKLKSLLRDEQLTLRQIAQSMEYHDVTAMVRAFKRAEGVTPTQYRKAMKVERK